MDAFTMQNRFENTVQMCEPDSCKKCLRNETRTLCNNFENYGNEKKTANRIELRIKRNCLLSHTFSSNAYLCILRGGRQESQRIYCYGNNVFLLFSRIGTHENISLMMNANGIKYAQHTHTHESIYTN